MIHEEDKKFEKDEEEKSKEAREAKYRETALRFELQETKAKLE